MDPNQNDQNSQDPAMPTDGGIGGQNPTPQPEPPVNPMPEPASVPEPTPTPAPASDAPQEPVDEITPPPPMMDEHPQGEQPTGIDQGSTGDSNPVA